MGNEKLKNILSVMIKKWTYSFWILLLLLGILFIFISKPHELMEAGLWILWVSPYFIPAFTTKDKKYWMITGIVILGLFVISLLGNYLGQGISEETVLYKGLTYVKNLYALAIFVLALICRKEIITISSYVHSDEYRFEHGLKEKEKKKEEIQKMRARNQVSTDAVEKTEKIQSSKTIETGIKKVDINNCSQEDFLTLPGMSLILAKKAVENREEQGMYQSLDDFVQRNNIKPHFMLQMQEMIEIGTGLDEQENPVVKKGRALDL